MLFASSRNDLDRMMRDLALFVETALGIDVCLVKCLDVVVAPTPRQEETGVSEHSIRFTRWGDTGRGRHLFVLRTCPMKVLGSLPFATQFLAHKSTCLRTHVYSAHVRLSSPELVGRKTLLEQIVVGGGPHVAVAYEPAGAKLVARYRRNHRRSAR